jgi:hypothetical protein
VHLTPDFWLEVSLRPEGPTTGKLGELVSKIDIALHASHAALQMVTSKLRPKVVLSMLNKNVILIQPIQL